MEGPQPLHPLELPEKDAVFGHKPDSLEGTGGEGLGVFSSLIEVNELGNPFALGVMAEDELHPLSLAAQVDLHRQGVECVFRHRKPLLYLQPLPLPSEPYLQDLFTLFGVGNPVNKRLVRGCPLRPDLQGEAHILDELGGFVLGPARHRLQLLCSIGGKIKIT